MRMRKRTVVGLAAAVVLVAAAAAIVIAHQRPVPELQVGEVEKVELYALNQQDIECSLSEGEVSSFVQALNAAEITGPGAQDYQNYVGGGTKMYRLTQKNGEVFEICPGAPFLIVNGKGYGCDEASLQALEVYYTDYHRRRRVPVFQDDEVEKVELYGMNGETIVHTLSDDETAGFLQAFNAIDVSQPETSDYQSQATVRPMYRLTQKDGEIFEISTAFPFLVVNGSGYRCDSEALQPLSAYFVDYHSEHPQEE